MAISFDCPHCRAHTEVDQQYAGQTGPCATCGKTITVPAPAGHEVPAAVSAAPVSNAPASKWSGTTMVIILAVVGGGMMLLLVGGILVALLLPAVNAAREVARQVECKHKLKQIAAAMHSYHADHGSFPPAYVADDSGKPMHSWRVLLLPYLEQQWLYDLYDFNKPWDSPENSALAGMMPSCYRCPSESDPSAQETSYRVVVGPGTMFPGEKTTTMDAITDGLSDTIMLVESSDSAVGWLEPTDLDVTQITFNVNPGGADEISSRHSFGANVAFGDANAAGLGDNVSSETVEAMITASAGETIPPMDEFDGF